MGCAYDYKQFGEWFKVKIDGPFVPNQTSTGHMNFPGYEQFPWKVEVKEMITNEYFSFTWHPYAIDLSVDYSKDTPTLVEFRLQKIEGGTLLKVTESGFEKIPEHRFADAMRMNEHGWEIQMQNIKEYVSKSEQPTSR